MKRISTLILSIVVAGSACSRGTSEVDESRSSSATNLLKVAPTLTGDSEIFPQGEPETITGAPAAPVSNSAVYTYDPDAHLHGVKTVSINQGQTTRSLSYDTAGNVMQITEGASFTQLTYTMDNRVKTSEKNNESVEYVYNADGKRVAKIIEHADGSFETVRYFHGEGMVVSSLGGAADVNAPVAWSRKAYMLGKERIAERTQQGTISLLFADHLGSVQVVTNRTGVVQKRMSYEPFGAVEGVPTAGAGPEYEFTGKERDQETGLSYFGARYYDASLRTFVQADTVLPDLTNPQSLNRYSYAYNNPIGLNDPSGHMPSGPAAAFQMLGLGISIATGQWYLTPLIMATMTTAGAAVDHHDLDKAGYETPDFEGEKIFGRSFLTSAATTAVSFGMNIGLQGLESKFMNETSFFMQHLAAPVNAAAIGAATSAGVAAVDKQQHVGRFAAIGASSSVLKHYVSKFQSHLMSKVTSAGSPDFHVNAPADGVGPVKAEMTLSRLDKIIGPYATMFNTTDMVVDPLAGYMTDRWALGYGNDAQLNFWERAKVAGNISLVDAMIPWRTASDFATKESDDQTGNGPPIGSW